MIDHKSHKERHVELHNALDELLGDFVIYTGRLLSATTVMEFVEWSYQQTIEPHQFLQEVMDE